MAGQTNSHPQAPVAAADRPKSKTLKPLSALWPYVRRYRLTLFGAIAMLLTAAGVTLLLPMASRRVIDLGFSPENAAFIDQYFVALLGVAAALAVATSLRFYLVTRLGERVIADIRKAVYDRVIGMRPGVFRDRAHRRDAVAADHGHHGDPIRGGVDRLDCAAQPVDFLRRSGADVDHKPLAGAADGGGGACDRGSDHCFGAAGAGVVAGVARPDRRQLGAGWRDAAGRADRAGVHL